MLKELYWGGYVNDGLRKAFAEAWMVVAFIYGCSGIAFS